MSRQLSRAAVLHVLAHTTGCVGLMAPPYLLVPCERHGRRREESHALVIACITAIPTALAKANLMATTSVNGGGNDNHSYSQKRNRVSVKCNMHGALIKKEIQGRKKLGINEKIWVVKWSGTPRCRVGGRCDESSP